VTTAPTKPADVSEAPPPSRPRGLAALGARCARHPLIVIAAWLALLVISVLADRATGGVFSDDVNLGGTQAYTGAQLLQAHEPQASGYSGLIVFYEFTGSIAPDKDAVETSIKNLGNLPHVLAASDPFAAAKSGGSTNTVPPPTVVSNVQFNVRPKTLGTDYLPKLYAATKPATKAGVRVEYGGALDELTAPSANDKKSELIGFGVALLVLLIGFGSIFGAALPLVTALIGVLVGVSLLGLAAAAITFGTASPTLAIMIGIGVGIDYALFLATRFRQLVADGVDPVFAAARTTGTSGHAVLIAASTVSVALLGLYASGVSFIGHLGLAAVFTVVVAALGAVTLVPAALGLLGRRIDRFKVRKPVAETGADDDTWHRYAATVERRPWWFVAGGVIVLAVLSIPMFSIRLGHIDDGASPSSYTSKRAYDLIANTYGPGANGPFTVVVDVRHAREPASQIASSVQKTLAHTPGVAQMSSLSASPDKVLLVGKLTPTTAPQAAQTDGLFNHLITDTVPQTLAGTGATGYITGTTASQLQFRDTLSARLPIIIAVVVVTAFLLVLASFRGLLLALKAAILNLLSIGAAYGVVVAVFQWGWGRSLIGVPENVPIESYVPMMMFAIVFGLSMDYEVFLLSRVKEAYDHSGDNTHAVATGLASTARVITCAALIMISVFTAFVASTSVVIKMLAIGLAASVLIDASVVRLVLVPATMTLFSKASWWMPRWLDKIIPRIDAEGHDFQQA
jgi:RND superfamily putative drug exporter